MAENKIDPNEEKEKKNNNAQNAKETVQTSIPQDRPPKTQSFMSYLSDYFDLKREKENEYATIEALKLDVDFKGTKVWILICAIFIASLGLNVNSTAVIIGAMLISPLMGPIIGLGLGLGIVDFHLVRRAIRNFAVATVIAIITSALYFLLSPISTAQSELLARTQPTIFDVLIAFFGGVAGVLAGATRSKGNVIPGVAIATALMPPLCTAGYGLATAQFNFFFGAFYLYIINSVFIGLATFLMIKVLKYPHMSYVNKEREKKLNYIVIAIVLCTAVPSIILGYRLIQENVFNESQIRFIDEQLNFPNSRVISKNVSTEEGVKIIDLTLIGEELPEPTIQELQAKLPEYGLRNTKLRIHQGLGNANLEAFRSDIMSNVERSSSDYIKYQQFMIDSLQTRLASERHLSTTAIALTEDIKQLFPEVTETRFGSNYSVSVDSMKMETTKNIHLTLSKPLTDQTKERITNWMHEKIPNSAVSFEVATPRKKN